MMTLKNTYIGNIIFALIGIITFLYLFNLGIQANEIHSTYSIYVLNITVFSTASLVILTFLFILVRKRIVNNNMYDLKYSNKGENLLNDVRSEGITFFGGCILSIYWMRSACLGLLGGATTCRLILLLYPNGSY